MKPNNHWYKLIASLLDESIDSKHHTDLYYAKPQYSTKPLKAVILDITV